jgi:hypothetical protein
MKLTSNKGKEIREEYSTTKEKQICDLRGLKQVGGSRTKIDGSDGVRNESIKNFSGNSTQVHLTTQKHFIEVLGLDSESAEFVRLFCGNSNLNVNGKDRYSIGEVNPQLLDSFISFLEENKERVIDLIIRNGFDITNIVYRNLKNGQTYSISYNEIIEKIKNCNWVAKKGGIHLKDQNGKTYFHFQREGKKNKNNRYNVLWHINKNIFPID